MGSKREPSLGKFSPQPSPPMGEREKSNRFIESTFRLASFLACLLGWLISLPATADPVSITNSSQTLLQQHLSKGDDITFSPTTLYTTNTVVTTVVTTNGTSFVTNTVVVTNAVVLSTPLIITNNASIDGLIISTDTNSNSLTNFVSIIGSATFNNVVTSIQTNLVLTTIYTTNQIVTTNGYDPITLQPILVTNYVPTTTMVYTNVVTTNISLIASGPRLFVINPGVTFTLRNLVLSGGLGTNYGGAISNGGTLLISNCVFVGNTAYGPPGSLGANGASSTYATGGDGQPGGGGGMARGGAIYNAGTARIVASQIVTNIAIAGNGGTGGKGGDGSWTGGTGGNGGNGGAAQGGAIYNSGVLTMQACLLTDDVVKGGEGGTGGVNGSGSPNGLVGKGGAGAQAAGGCLYNAGTVFLAACTFAWNNSTAGDSQKAGTPDLVSLRNGYAGGDSYGGAVFNAGANTMVNCTLSYNTVQAGKGGDGGDGRIDSLAYGNGGNGGNAWGGGLFNNGTSVLTNCTLAGGGAMGGAKGIGTTSPFVGNDGNPGGAYGGNLAGSGGTCSMRASILASSSAGANAYGSVNNLGYNLSSDSTPAISGLGSVLNTNAQLAPLDANGGPVPTMALLATTNNPALDKVVPPALPALFDPPTDARGIVRPQGGRGDIGAFELEAANLSGHITADGQPLANVPIAVTTPAGVTNIITDATGYYAFTNLPPGMYTLIPATNGYDFTPPVRTLVVSLTPTTNADFTAAGYFTIYGQITTDGFTGLAGAKVTAGARSDVTDADGYYALTNMAPGTVVVTPQLTNYGFLPASDQVTVADTDVNGVDFGAVLVWTISGTITNEAMGKGWSNVTVMATSVFSFGGQSNSTTVTANSDSSGVFRLTNVPAGTVTLQLAAVGYVFGVTNTFTLTNNATINLRIHSAFSISGIVIFGGAGLGGVSVTATATNGAATASALTDASGVYVLNLLPTNRYTIQAQLAGYTFNTNSVYVPPNATNINFTAQGALSISGHVRRNGQGLSGVSVVVGTALPVTDTSGYYMASNLPPGNYTVTPYLARQVFSPTNIPVPLTTDSVTGQDFTATPLCNINGRVTLGGVGLSNVNVRAGTTAANTDHNGYYTLTAVSGGSNVAVTPALTNYAFAPASSNLALWANAANINFSALRVFNISGLVGMGGSSGVAGVTIVAGTNTTTTDHNGLYSLTTTNSGTSVNVTPSLAGYAFSPTPGTALWANTGSINVNFSAQGTLGISGYIRTNGVGVSGVLVAVGGTNPVTDGSGFYIATNLSPGPYTVAPSLAQYVFVPSNILVTLTTTNTTGQNFTGFPLCSISGRVTLAGVGFPNVAVTAVPITSTSDLNGYYTLTSVPGGSNVVVTPRLTGYAFTPASSALTLWANATNINFAVRVYSISGQLLEGTNGVSGVAVSAGHVTNVSSPEGFYSLADLTNGTYTVRPQAVGVGFRPASSNVTLNAASLSNVNFTANPPHISIALSNGTPMLTVTGLPLRRYEVLANTNSPGSTNWQLMVAEYADTNAVFTVLDTNAPAFKARFYRPSTP